MKQILKTIRDILYNRKLTMRPHEHEWEFPERPRRYAICKLCGLTRGVTVQERKDAYK